MDFIIFPFHEILKGERIAIYGGGQIYQLFKQQIEATGYCDIAWVVDQRFAHKDQSKEDISNTQNLHPSDVDWSKPCKIIVASLKFKDEIVTYLKNAGVEDSRIITISERYCLKVQNRLNLKPDQQIWQSYYHAVEGGAQSQYRDYIEPLLEEYTDEISFDSVLDFACGEGRMAELFKGKAKKLYLIDAGSQAIESCRKRFENNRNIQAICNNSGAIPLENETVSFVYSWDAMVHFSYKLLDYYLSEFSRVTLNGGYIFIHHSNLANLAGTMQIYELWSLNPECRSDVSKEDVAYLARRHNLEVIKQHVFDWGVADIDCITILRKPCSS